MSYGRRFTQNILHSQNELNAYISELRSEAIKDPENKNLLSEFNKYLIIRRSSKNENGYTVNVSEDAIDKLKTRGLLVLVSNYIKNSMNLNRREIYRDKMIKNRVGGSFDRPSHTTRTCGSRIRRFLMKPWKFYTRPSR